MTVEEQDKKELVLRLPDALFQVIKRFKDVSGVSYTNFILTAIVFYCLREGLISLEYLRNIKGVDKNDL